MPLPRPKKRQVPSTSSCQATKRWMRRLISATSRSIQARKGAARSAPAAGSYSEARASRQASAS